MAYTAQQIMSKTPVVPVIVIHNLDHAVPLAQALVAGGIPVLEVTLRTALGLKSIEKIKNEVEGAIVGAGTVLNQQDLADALNHGSEFIITPGITPALLAEGARCGVPFMPGFATIGELMQCRDQGLEVLKFFPAEANGGAKTLKAFSGPFPNISFCPTGGIGLHNIEQYLSLPSVLGVGGSWLCPEELVKNEDWQGITSLAKETCRLVAEIREKFI